MANEFETVEVEVEDGIRSITIDRPEKKNAMNPTLHAEMCEVISNATEDALDPDGETRVLVLTGTGDSFCAGQDLDEFFKAHEDDPWAAQEVGKMSGTWGRGLWEFPAPTIAAVNGWCFGAGVRVLTSCDMAIASDEARFGLSEVNFGHFPAGGSTYVPNSVLQQRDFLYLSLTGKEIDAETAEMMRLVNEAVPDERLDDEVRDIAETIADLDPLAVKYAKDVFKAQDQSHMPYDVAVDYELAKTRELERLQDVDKMTAIEAFNQGRFRPGVESYRSEDVEDLT